MHWQVPVPVAQSVQCQNKLTLQSQTQKKETCAEYCTFSIITKGPEHPKTNSKHQFTSALDLELESFLFLSSRAETLDGAEKYERELSWWKTSFTSVPHEAYCVFLKQALIFPH